MSEIPEKLFYKPGEVCKYTDTQPYVLRFWESEFPQLAPGRNRTGQRVYRREDLEMVLRIKKLLYEQEYTIADARRALDAALIADGAPAGEPAVPPADDEPAPHDGGPRARTAGAGSAHPGAPLDVRERAEAEEVGDLRRRLAELERACVRARGELAESEAAHRALRERAHRMADRLERLLETLSGSRRGDEVP